MLIAKELILLTARKIAERLGHTFIGVEHFNTAVYALTCTELFKKNYDELIAEIGKGTPQENPEITDELKLAYLFYPSIVRIED